MKSYNFFPIAVLIIISTSCKLNTKSGATDEIDSLDLISNTKPINPLDTLGEGLPIFYNMYLSVELSSLFETAGAVFQKGLLNSDENIGSYITSSQKALNMGVYAVDLSYARAFDEFDVAGRYFNAMQRLAEELGIPTNYFIATAQRFERNMTDKDSLIKIANEVYVETEKFLNENERYATASMIIIGGWIEAVYIASSIALESNDPLVIERFLEQKYSLTNLLILLKDYRTDEVIEENIIKLSQISEEFNKVEIDFPQDLDVNTTSGNAIMSEAKSQVKNIQSLLKPLRDNLIN